MGYVCCDADTGLSNTNSDWKGTGWYRVTGPAGSKLIESPVEAYKFCGTHHTGWLDGGHPSPSEGEVSRTVYFKGSGSNPKTQPHSVKVINCNNDYFVYHLQDLPCNRAYCTE